MPQLGHRAYFVIEQGMRCENLLLQRLLSVAAVEVGPRQKPATGFGINRNRPQGLFGAAVVEGDLGGANGLDRYDARIESVLNEQLNFAGFGLVLPNNAIRMHLFSPCIQWRVFFQSGSY